MGPKWRTHMVPCQPEDRVPFLIGILRGPSFKTFLPREDKFFIICPKHHIYWHESVLPGGHHMATEIGSVHGLESCVLEDPGSRKDLLSAEEAPSSTTRQGPGEGRGPRGSVPIMQEDDLGPDTESAATFPVPLPQLPVVFMWQRVINRVLLTPTPHQAHVSSASTAGHRKPRCKGRFLHPSLLKTAIVKTLEILQTDDKLRAGNEVA